MFPLRPVKELPRPNFRVVELRPLVWSVLFSVPLVQDHRELGRLAFLVTREVRHRDEPTDLHD